MLKDIKDAEEFYKALDCSKFHMARAFYVTYKEYQEMNISRETEVKWCREKFDIYYNNIINQDTCIDAWILHSKLVNFARFIKDATSVMRLLDITGKCFEVTKESDRIMIIESIIGRLDISHRDGVIFLAYDLDMINEVNAFTKLLDDMILHSQYVDESRVTKAEEKLRIIREELGY